MILPRVKDCTFQGDAVCLSSPLTVFAGEDTERAAALLGLFLPEIPIKSAGEEACVAAKQIGCDRSEAYTLRVEDGRVQIEYSSYLGLRNALATLSGLIRVEGGRVTVPAVQICDAPAAAHRGLMLDPARGPMPMERLKNDLILAAKCKFNLLHFHVIEAAGLALELTSLPVSLRLDGAYTREQAAEICDLCDLLGLEIMPELDLPAHATRLTSVFPELRCTGDEQGWTVCPGSEKTFEIYERVMDELISWFPGGRYFHIGGDELEFRDLTPPRFCRWDECEKCRQLRRVHGLRDRQEEYYYVMRRMNDAVKRRGRRTVMWSDQVDCSRPAGLPDDILMQFWRVAAPGRGPYEGCSMQAQLAMGYQVINSYYPETYADFQQYMNTERFGTWRWDRVPECAPEQTEQIMGSELCAWDYGNEALNAHYSYSLGPAVVLFGDKMWSGEDADYTAAGAAVTRTLLGPAAPEGLDVFAAVGDVLTPRNKGLSYPERVTLSSAEAERIAAVLRDGSLFAGPHRDRAARLLPCVENTLAAQKTE